MSLEGNAGQSVAGRDVVAGWDEAGDDLPPLIVLEGLKPHLPGTGPIEARRLGSGHSNETFLVTRDGRELVLRRPPRPPLPPTAHDVLREARIMTALADLGVRVPRPLLIHEGSEAIGAPFFLMEMVPGVVVRDSMPPALEAPGARRELVSGFVDALVDVHAAPWRGTALEAVGRPDGYLERQLRRWRSQWDHNRTRPLPDIESIGEWLAARLPSGAATTVVHGDAKLDNAIYAAAPPVRLAALVDWEMATLGDPLSDLGFMCATYVGPGEAVDPAFGFTAVTADPESPSREEIAAWYAERSGRTVDDLLWYEALGLWKITILLEGSYGRYLAGTTSDQFFALLERGIPRLAARTAARLRAEG